MARGRKPKFREISGKLTENESTSGSLGQQVESINRVLMEPVPNYPRVVLTEVRSVFSDGSVTFEVRTNADNAHRR